MSRYEDPQIQRFNKAYPRISRCRQSPLIQRSLCKEMTNSHHYTPPSLVDQYQPDATQCHCRCCHHHHLCWQSWLVIVVVICDVFWSLWGSYTEQSLGSWNSAECSLNFVNFSWNAVRLHIFPVHYTRMSNESEDPSWLQNIHFGPFLSTSMDSWILEFLYLYINTGPMGPRILVSLHPQILGF